MYIRRASHVTETSTGLGGHRDGTLRVDDPGPGFEDLLPRLPNLILASRSQSTTTKYTSYFRAMETVYSGKGSRRPTN